MSDAPPDFPDDEDLVAEDDRAIGRFFRRSLLLAGIVAAIALGSILLSRRDSEPEPILDAPATAPHSEAPSPPERPPTVVFRDISAAAGLDFVHENGARGDKLLPETLGAGAAFFDYDADGDPDLLFANGRPWPDARESGAHPTPALFRNDGSGHFEDVSAGSGLDASLYGMGVAVGDYDGDGWTDVFLTAVGENRLLRNLGGRFVDVTESAGVAGAEDAWSTGAAFVDVDRDGDLDLFVVNYVRWSREIDFEIDFQLTGIGRAYGPPTTFEGTHPYLYRNEGNGRFSDVSDESGVRVENPTTGRATAKSLAVLPVDLDDDGWVDFVVSNDTVQNHFFHNQQDGTFAETGVRVGVAFDRDGASTGAMGIDAAYFRNDADLGIAIGNFANEMTSFYVAQGAALQLADEAIGTGVGPESRLALTFGLFFFDYDLDGRLDLLQVNGHLEDEIHRVQPSQRYEQAPQLFWNAGSKAPRQYVPVSAGESGEFGRPLVGRGATYADIDGDADLDVLITQAGRRPVLLRNEQELGHHWLRVRLVGRGGNRDAIGARVELEAGGARQRRQLGPTRSYLSQVEPTLTFGLGALEEGARIGPLRVRWPDGTMQVIESPPVDALLEIEQEPARDRADIDS
jgi:hypothetical protein